MSTALSWPEFERAVAEVAAAKTTVVSPEDQDLLYALFKQARHGDLPPDLISVSLSSSSAASSSRYTQLAKSGKFEAWARLRGVPQEDAASQYVHTVQRVFGGGGGYNSSSTLVVVTPQRPPRQQQKVSATTPSRTVMSALQGGGKHLTPASATSRVRALSLDSSFFVLSPLVSVQEVADRVKELGQQTPAIPLAIPPPPTSRILSHLQGVGNARDLGGLSAVTWDGKPGRIRFGRLIRCGQLGEATEEDAKWLVGDFAIRTLLDLRQGLKPLPPVLHAHFAEHVEISSASHVLPPATASTLRVAIPLICRNVHQHVVRKNARAYHKLVLFLLVWVKRVAGFVRRVLAALPLLEVLAVPLGRIERAIKLRLQLQASRLFTGGGLATVFSSILLQDQDNLVGSAVRVAGDPARHPLAFHCAFGKDRTGLLACVLLHCLGVSRQDIVHDFALSHPYVFETERGAREWQGLMLDFPHMDEVKHEFGASREEHLLQCLQDVEREHGSLDAYITNVLQLDNEWRQQLRRDLVVEE